MIKKTVDAIAIKRRGAAKVHRQLEGKSVELQARFWHQRTRALKQRQQRMRSKSLKTRQ